MMQDLPISDCLYHTNLWLEPHRNRLEAEKQTTQNNWGFKDADFEEAV